MKRFRVGIASICLAALLLLIGCNPSRAQQNAATNPALEQILWWLPQDTETLLVSRGPFVTKLKELLTNPRNYREAATARGFQNFHWSFSSLQAGGFVKGLQDQTILLSVEGSRNPRPPKGFGMTPYEGCSILIVKENARQPLAAVLRAISTKAKHHINIAGRRVLVFEEKQEQDIWKRYVVCPTPNVFLVATNRSYLESVLMRMRHKPSVRAFPATLPQWKFVDRNAQYWAVRNIAQGKVDQGVASDLGDKTFMGATLSFNPRQSRKASIFYFSKSKNAFAIMKKLWMNPPEGIYGQAIKRSATTTQIVVDFDQKGQGLTVFTFYVLSFFGHAIIV